MIGVFAINKTTNETTVCFGYAQAMRNTGVSIHDIKRVINKIIINEFYDFIEIPQSEVVKYKISRSNKKKKISKCKNCGCDFYGRQEKNYTPMFCSVECRYNYKREFFKDKPQIFDGKLICHKCEKYKDISEYYDDNAKDYRLYKMVVCSDCCNELDKQNILKKTGYRYMLSKRLRTAKNSSISRNLEFNIDLKFLCELYERQNGLCAISGVKMEYGESLFRNSKSISIDRIDSTKGYLTDNVHLVCWAVNQMKNNLDTDELIFWCNNIIKNNKNEHNSH